MSFLVVMLALLIEKLTGWRERIQQDGPWLGALRRIEANPRLAASPWLALLLLVGVPGLLLGGLLLALAPLAYGWLSLPLHVLVLLYAMGRGHAKRELGPFRDAWRRGDQEAAALVAERDLGVSGETPARLLEAVQGYLLWKGYQGFFAVLFWYLLLGPVAALVYRLLVLLVEHSQQAPWRERAERILHAFDWLAVRALLASFALVGNFVEVSRASLHEILGWDTPARQLLAEVAPKAADLPEARDDEAGNARLDTLAELLVRSRLLWYAAIAVWTIWG
ncbi:regulatory signaling modulator protein AmpE [Pseudomonas sp. ABC1]|uniref:regulatory signaling modulator protein AmpE n=1 Tax=Pseudomonas sp. ABC1 TaxID=2748080 RepID=UPI0015C3A513|nr:regulatory signaling modulator protein AmpE [Pseudomonas sp. ABC1]QLF93309.1 regulatory signaling modulator protein AmpE [Pseudomonas sp. ABC1]